MLQQAHHWTLMEQRVEAMGWERFFDRAAIALKELDLEDLMRKH